MSSKLLRKKKSYKDKVNRLLILEDEMDGKIHKSQKDLKSLLQTLANLKGRNNNLKSNLILEKTGDIDKAKVQELEQSVMAANKEKFDKLKEYDRENADMIQNELILKEKEEEVYITNIR
jgi:hypothetical protein